MPTPLNNATQHAAATGQQTCPPGIIPASFLFQGHREVLIDRNGELYRLSITKNGKLILTK